MNLKQAKRLRRRALRVFAAANKLATLGVSTHPHIEGTQYERHNVRGNVRVAPNCPRGVYHLFKRTALEVKRSNA
jgi:hypothetical protein